MTMDSRHRNTAVRLVSHAAAFLQETADVVELHPDNCIDDAERRLVAAAALLRCAHEATGCAPEDFPDRGLWQFVRISRNIQLHTGRTPRPLGATNASFEFDVVEDKVRATFVGGKFQGDLERAAELLKNKPSPSAIAVALEFAQKHDMDWFVALVEATHETAMWLETGIDGLGELRGRRLTGITQSIQLQSTERFKRWAKPVLDRHRMESGPTGPIRMTGPADQPADEG